MRTILLLDNGVPKRIRKLKEETKGEDWLGEWVRGELKVEGKWVEMVEAGSEKEFVEGAEVERGTFETDAIEWSEVEWYKSKYPLLSKCIAVATSEATPLSAFEKQNGHSKLGFELVKLKETASEDGPKHNRFLSDKVDVKHHGKQVSNFSNFSAISKIEHHSVLSNEPSLDMF